MEHNNNMIENNNNGSLYPMMMIPPSLSHQHHQNQNQNQNHNSHHNNNSNKIGVLCSSSSNIGGASVACYDHLMGMEETTHHHHHHQQQQQHQHHASHQNNNMINNNTNNNNSSIKAKIMSHPHYPRLLSAFLNCQKVGAPPEVVARLEEAEAMTMNQQQSRGGGGGGGGYIGEDPGLDQFMEAYSEMLTKYEQELTKPFKEAMVFLSRIESQFKTLTLSSSSDSPASSGMCGEMGERNGSSEEDIDVNNNLIDPSVEDWELKGQLLRKYSGYLGSLRQEFLKKRKKGKLPKEARQQLLDWWSHHYKWPYPSESQKVALAEETGLDQKQINNWFINQRKRHWKPSEDMQFVVMDAAAAAGGAHPIPSSSYSYMDNNTTNNNDALPVAVAVAVPHHPTFPMDLLHVPPTLI